MITRLSISRRFARQPIAAGRWSAAGCIDVLVEHGKATDREQPRHLSRRVVDGMDRDCAGLLRAQKAAAGYGDGGRRAASGRHDDDETNESVRHALTMNLRACTCIARTFCV